MVDMNSTLKVTPKTISIRRRNDSRLYILQVLGTNNDYPFLGESALLETAHGSSIAQLTKWAAQHHPTLPVVIS
jgi:hypothetical protein